MIALRRRIDQVWVVTSLEDDIGSLDAARARLEAVQPIEPEWIIAIHREGDPTFDAIGRGYPASFVANPDQTEAGYTLGQ